MEILDWNETDSVMYGMGNFSHVDLIDQDLFVEDSWETRSKINKASIIALAIIFCLALLGNTVVVIVLLRQHFKKDDTADRDSAGSSGGLRPAQSHAHAQSKISHMQWFILHLSLADIFVAFFNVLPQLIWHVTGRFQGNDFLCRGVTYFQVVAMYASSYTMMMLAIDRYLTVCSTSRSKFFQRRVAILVSMAWGLSLVFSIPQILIFSYKEVAPNIYDCWATFTPHWTMQFYVTFVTAVLFVIPLIILVFCYARICFEIWGSARYRATYRANGRENVNGQTKNVIFKPQSDVGERFYNPDEIRKRTENKMISTTKVKTIALSFTIVIFYILCWAPFFVVQTWSVYDVHAPLHLTVLAVIMRMANLNSCTNPLIYLMFSAVWRRNRKDTLLKSFVLMESVSSSGCNVEMSPIQQEHSVGY